MNKLVGLCFDGCSVMTGKENGVQKIISDKYSKATFFHCASHRLNMVVNDLNAVTEIQNTVGVVKEVFNFFRENWLQIYHFCVILVGLRNINLFAFLLKTLLILSQF